MEWVIKYFNNSVEESILALPDGLLARYLRLTDMIAIARKRLKEARS